MPNVRRWTWGLSMLVVACTRHRVGEVSPVAELRLASDAYARAFASKSADSVVAFFAPDVVVMSPQAPRPVFGVEANRAAWARFFSGQNPEHRVTTDSLAVGAGGDIGYTLGGWSVSIDTPRGRASSEGTYLAVWRRFDGKWKMVAVSAFTHR